MAGKEMKATLLLLVLLVVPISPRASYIEVWDLVAVVDTCIDYKNPAYDKNYEAWYYPVKPCTTHQRVCRKVEWPVDYNIDNFKYYQSVITPTRPPGIYCDTVGYWLKIFEYWGEHGNLYPPPICTTLIPVIKFDTVKP